MNEQRPIHPFGDRVMWLPLTRDCKPACLNTFHIYHIYTVLVQFVRIEFAIIYVCFAVRHLV